MVAGVSPTGQTHRPKPSHLTGPLAAPKLTTRSVVRCALPTTTIASRHDALRPQGWHSRVNPNAAQQLPSLVGPHSGCKP